MNKIKRIIFCSGLCLATLFATGCNSTAIQGKDGKSAYEIYCKYHPEYSKTEEEWINEFYENSLENSKDVYDPLCNNFSFDEAVIDGTRGYIVKKYFGYDEEDHIDIVIPSYYNHLPVIGVFAEEDDGCEYWCPNKTIKSIRFPKTIKLLSISMIRHILTNKNTLPDLYFEGDVKYILDFVYQDYVIGHLNKVCFDGTVEEFLNTNLCKCFCNVDIYFKKGNDYVCELPQKNKFETVSNSFNEEFNKLVEGLILSLKENRKFTLPKYFSIPYNGEVLKYSAQYNVSDAGEFNIPVSSNAESYLYDLSSSEFNSLFNENSGRTISINASIFYNEKVTFNQFAMISSRQINQNS